MHHTVPVHAISFNCNDKEANEFLFDLAKATGGRYHYFSEKGKDLDQPESWEVIYWISFFFSNSQIELSPLKCFFLLSTSLLRFLGDKFQIKQEMDLKYLFFSF